jgi:TolB-like protein/Tfp pilus assembly protein PilF
MSLFAELKRRNVFKVGAAYVVVSWLLIQAAGVLEPALLLPDWVDRVVTVFLLIGFPIVLIFAWAFEMTPEGLKLERDVDRSESITPKTGKKLEHATIGALALALVVVGIQHFSEDDHENEPASERPGALPTSIAVLPFEDFSEAKDQEYFSRGISEEILNLLAKTNALRVAARTSSFAFAGSELDIREIGRKLDVETVLEGSIRKSGDTLRITAQLVSVEDGYHMWSETYDRDYADIFKIQDEISEHILAAMKVHLLGADAAPIEKHASERTANLDAYDAYLIGKERQSRRTKDDLAAARTKFEEAVELDASFAPAHVELAHTLLLMERREYGDLSSEETEPLIQEHISRALELDPDTADGIAVSGLHHFSRFRYDEAEKQFDKAIGINPNHALAYLWRSETAYQQQRYLDMLADKEKAYSLDPMSLEISAQLAFDYRSFWRPRDAERVIERMFELHPDHPLAFDAAIENLSSHGRYGEAALMAETAMEAHPDNEDFRSWLSWMLMSIGLFDEATALDDDQSSFFIALYQDQMESARSIVDRRLQEERPRQWYWFARLYYLKLGGEENMARFRQLLDAQVARMDEMGVPWRESCNLYLINDLRTAGMEEPIESMMTRCHKQFEERLKAQFFCPCSYYGLVGYTVLDGRIEEAVQRADQWLSNGDSWVFLDQDPIFDQLADQPEYAELLARNQEQVERQQRIYLTRKEVEATFGGP